MNETLIVGGTETTQTMDLPTTFLYIVTARSGDMAVYKSGLGYDAFKQDWAKSKEWYVGFSDGLVRIDDVASVRPYFAVLMAALKKVDSELATDSWHAYAALRSSLLRVDGEEDYESDSDQFDALGGGDSYRTKA